MPSRKSRLLILGGTAEAVELARRCVGIVDVISSLAGATENPVQPPGKVRVGGFGGAQGLVRYLVDETIDLVIDATHPFAARMQANAAEACALAAVPRCRLLRPEWPRQTGDRWIEAANLDAAVRSLQSLGPRVFLALGARDLPAFAGLLDRWFLVRAISPLPSPIANGLFVQGRGPFGLADERRLLSEHRIDAVVSRQSGGEGARAKIDAARDLGLPVVMICRPTPPPPPLVATVEAALEWLGECLSERPPIETLAQTGQAGAV